VLLFRRFRDIYLRDAAMMPGTAQIQAKTIFQKIC
jgi:hypothetical protein